MNNGFEYRNKNNELNEMRNRFFKIEEMYKNECLVYWITFGLFMFLIFISIVLIDKVDEKMLLDEAENDARYNELNAEYDKLIKEIEMLKIEFNEQ